MDDRLRCGVLLAVTAVALPLLSCAAQPCVRPRVAGEVFADAIILPYPSQEDIQGVRIRQPAKDSFLGCIGLRHDDVIVGWNGTPIDGPASSAGMLRALIEAPRFSLEVTDAAGKRRVLDYEAPEAP